MLPVPCNPPIDEMMTTDPRPAVRMSGITIWISQWLDRMLLSRILRNWSSLIPLIGP